jgi:UDP-glucose 4-epimerase/UDP-arabinose 4-epimerase
MTVLMRQLRPSAVIHLAGLIEVGRSVVHPEAFYDVNVGGMLSVLGAMRRARVPRLVFSSSAAVYGAQASSSPLTEDLPLAPTSPYGDTKLAAERMLAAYAEAYGLEAIALRYFNASGADPGGELGEAHDPETHLIPLAIDAALGAGPPLKIFGRDFETADGTCIRDYVHVCDVARAHLAACTLALPQPGLLSVNVGAGRGSSVLEVVDAVERAVGVTLPRVFGDRRAGDPPVLVADISRASTLLQWRPERSDLTTIISDAVRWHRHRAHK